MWEEAVEMIPRMWESDRFSHEGQYFSVPERNVIPKPVQKPHPPIWMACSQAESFEIAAGKDSASSASPPTSPNSSRNG